MKRLLFVFLLLPAFLKAQSYIIVLGVAQDGGYPHIGCEKNCCKKALNNNDKRYVTSLALVDPEHKKWWLFEATPDIKEQLSLFRKSTNKEYPYLPEGIFITHAHMGHYTGLMQLGREAMGTNNVTVYALPRMKDFLETNGPWSQLIELKNINLTTLSTKEDLALNNNISINSFTVPHRDEYSETAGFNIMTTSKSYLFIPDINKWSQWDKSISKEIDNVDVAFIDATFYNNEELPNRDMSEIPHPFVEETMKLLEKESTALKNKVYFIHFNHTNKLMWDSLETDKVESKGYHVSQQLLKI